MKIQSVREYYRTLAPVLDPSLERRGDEAFWRRVARSRPDRVLELGCGTGRITAPLAAGAGRVIGLDISGPLLRRARRHLADRSNVHLVAGDMRRLPLGGRFDLVAAANDPFAHLLSDGERNRALREAAARLAPGGRFILDALWLEPERLRAAASPGGWTVERERRGPAGVLHVTERWRCDLGTLRCTVRYSYESDGAPAAEAACRVRCWTFAEARDRLRAAGLALRKAWGGYDGAPWRDHGASALVLEAEAPAGVP